MLGDRHCYSYFNRYLRCVDQNHGEDAPACRKLKKGYLSLCPLEWVEEWKEQLESGTFPGYKPQGSDDGFVGKVRKLEHEYFVASKAARKYFSVRHYRYR